MYKYFFNIYFVDVVVGKLASGELEERKVRKTDQSKYWNNWDYNQKELLTL